MSRTESNPETHVEAEVHRKDTFDAFGEPIRERFGEPLQRVTELTKKTLALFPVRVWRHFLARNGFLLAAGMSYQALFAVFAAVYVVFSIAGIWFASRPETMKALEDLINTYVPGLIGEQGAIKPSDLTAIADSSTALLGWTGVIAAGGLIWTAIGWVTYSRIGVRSVFGLPKDTRSYVLLKARDLVAALIFGVVLLVASTLTVASTAALSWMFSLFGIASTSIWYRLAGGTVGLLLVLLINAGVLASMFRFLSGATVPWRNLWGGSLLGGGALTVLQGLGGVLVGGVSRNPLLATFAVFVGLLIWFRLTSIVTLVAAAWIAVAAGDQGVSLRTVTSEQLEAERRETEQRALLLASEVELREAQVKYDSAAWYNKAAAAIQLRQAKHWQAKMQAMAAEAAKAAAEAEQANANTRRWGNLD